jgi:hypothetical protein
VLNKEIKICKILTFSQEDFLSLNLEFSTSGVDVLLCDINEKFKEEEFPTIIVGWSNVKCLFPKQRISQKKISDNVFWVYSPLEEKKSAITDTKKIVKNFLSNWLPDTYVPYDLILDGKLSKFLESHFKKPYKLYVYFSGKALFMYNEENPDKTIGISLESMKYAGVDVKKAIVAIMEKYSPVCLSYSNISPYVTESNNLVFPTIENLFWARYNEEISEKNFYDFMMDTESDRFIPFLMFELYKRQTISDNEKVYMDRLIKKDLITEWLSKRELFFDKSYVNEKIVFKKSPDNMPYIRLTYSDKRTITGRINCVDRRFNPQNIARESPERKMIVSRFKNGKIVVFDYVSFETKISLFLSQDKKFIEKYKNKDLHEETAKVIYEKKQVNSQERSVGKSINHTLLYGGGEEVLNKHLNGIEDKENALERVREFLSPIIETSEQLKNSADEIGYLINTFGTIVRPQKSWASFSNYVSALAADMLVEKLYDIKEFTSKHKSKFLFQVHDSFVFDIHPDEKDIIEEIEKLLSNFKDINFQVKSSAGNNLYECGSTKEVKDTAV